MYNIIGLYSGLIYSKQALLLLITVKAVCQCGATAEPFPFTEFVHYISTAAMM